LGDGFSNSFFCGTPHSKALRNALLAELAATIAAAGRKQRVFATCPTQYDLCLLPK
jgi:hypothetical protein